MPTTEKITPRFVQIRSPWTGRYAKIDREKGEVLPAKVSDGPYKNIPMASMKPYPASNGKR